MRTLIAIAAALMLGACGQKVEEPRGLITRGELERLNSPEYMAARMAFERDFGAEKSPAASGPVRLVCFPQ